MRERLACPANVACAVPSHSGLTAMRFSPHQIRAYLVSLRLPFTSRRLLLITLLSLIGVMVSMLVYTSRQLEALSVTAVNYSATALAVADDVGTLHELTIDMERSARQFYILADARLATDFTEALVAGKQIASRLSGKLRPQSARLTARWIMLGDDVAAQLKKGSSASPQLQQRVFAQFRELALVNQKIEQESRLTIQQGAQDFEQGVTRYRETLVSIGTGVAAVSILAAVALGLWLSWLFDSLAFAITGLGDRTQREVPPIGGPTDMHALAERIRSVKLTLESLEKDKDLFVRHISHELKTPLANLREGIALLEAGVVGSLGGEQRQIVTILDKNAALLQAQIEDLLQYNTAVFAPGRLDLAPVALRALIEEMVDEQKLRLELRDIRVEIVGWVDAASLDASKLRIIISNLLANAIHFCPHGGRIRFIVEQTDQQLVMDCIDEGCGVAPEDADKIFNPFYQGSRQVPAVKKGSGIGLSIVRLLAEAHRGTAALLPSQVGAHFRITLPRNQP